MQKEREEQAFEANQRATLQQQQQQSQASGGLPLTAADDSVISNPALGRVQAATDWSPSVTPRGDESDV